MSQYELCLIHGSCHKNSHVPSTGHVAISIMSHSYVMSLYESRPIHGPCHNISHVTSMSHVSISVTSHSWVTTCDIHPKMESRRVRKPTFRHDGNARRTIQHMKISIHKQSQSTKISIYEKSQYMKRIKHLLYVSCIEISQYMKRIKHQKKISIHETYRT